VILIFLETTPATPTNVNVALNIKGPT